MKVFIWYLFKKPFFILIIEVFLNKYQRIPYKINKNEKRRKTEYLIKNVIKVPFAAIEI